VKVEIFCDGACSGNPGPGGFGCVLRSGSKEKELSGSDPHTTNNRMEMMAAITALESLKRPCDVVLTTDSQYLVKGMTEWIDGWLKRGWKKQQERGRPEPGPVGEASGSRRGASCSVGLDSRP